MSFGSKAKATVIARISKDVDTDDSIIGQQSPPLKNKRAPYALSVLRRRYCERTKKGDLLSFTGYLTHSENHMPNDDVVNACYK